MSLICSKVKKQLGLASICELQSNMHEEASPHYKAPLHKVKSVLDATNHFCGEGRGATAQEGQEGKPFVQKKWPPQGRLPDACEYPPPGEQQVRWQHSNARSMIRFASKGKHQA